MGDQTGLSGDDRYLVHRWITDPAARAAHPPEEQARQARTIVADLRAAVGRRAGDPTFVGLIERLLVASSDFRRLWAEHEVAVRRANRKTQVGRPLNHVCLPERSHSS